MQNQSPSTTQILISNFEQDFDRVNDLIFGLILIWNWRFFSPLQLFRRQLPHISLLKSCFGPPQCKEVEAVCYAATLSPLMLECHGIESSMLRHWLFCQFSSISNAMAFCAQCCGIEATVNLLNSANAMASSPQYIGIQSIFLILYLFWIISFFFQLQCSSYCLQHKILCKSVQNTNNANKITKYWGLKYIKLHSYHQDISKRKR